MGDEFYLLGNCLTSVCGELDRVSSLRWLGGRSAFSDTRFETLFDLLNKTRKPDGGIKRSTCHTERMFICDGHRRESMEGYCMVINRRDMRQNSGEPGTYTVVLLAKLLTVLTHL